MNRRTLVLTSLATLPIAALAMPLAAQHRSSRPRTSRAKPVRRRQRGGLTASRVRTRIVTRTFTSRVPITIPLAGPASPYPSTIRVGGFNQGRILKVRVTLIGLTHTFPIQLDFLLAAPGNVGVMILSDPTDISVNNVTFTLDQDAPGTPTTLLVNGGVYQPANLGPALDPMPPPAPQGVSGHALSRFNNRNPNGVWKLFVHDVATIDQGSLAGWSLQIRARVRVGRRANRRSARRTKR